MLNANSIREDITKEFQENFDFEKFDNYINDYFINKKERTLNIGLEYDQFFKKGIPNIGYGKEYIWETGIQVPNRYQRQVEEYLRNAGFNAISYKAPGFDDWDIIKVSI